MEQNLYKMELTKDQVQWVIDQDNTKKRIDMMDEDLRDARYFAQQGQGFIRQIVDTIGYKPEIINYLPKYYDRTENEIYIKTADQTNYMVIKFDELKNIYNNEQK